MAWLPIEARLCAMFLASHVACGSFARLLGRTTGTWRYGLLVIGMRVLLCTEVAGMRRAHDGRACGWVGTEECQGKRDRLIRPVIWWRRCKAAYASLLWLFCG